MTRKTYPISNAAPSEIAAPPVRHAGTVTGLFLLAGMSLAACAPLPPTPYSAGAGPFPPPAGSAGGGIDPSWMVCQGGNPRADYNCTLR